MQSGVYHKELQYIAKLTWRNVVREAHTGLMSLSVCLSVQNTKTSRFFMQELNSGCPRGVFCLSSIPSEYLFPCARRKFRFNKKIRKNLLIVYVYYQPNSFNTHAELELAGGTFLRQRKKVPPVHTKRVQANYDRPLESRLVTADSPRNHNLSQQGIGFAIIEKYVGISKCFLISKKGLSFQITFITASKQLGQAWFFSNFFHMPQRPAEIETRIEPRPLAEPYRPLWSKSRGACSAQPSLCRQNGLSHIRLVCTSMQNTPRILHQES